MRWYCTDTKSFLCRNFFLDLCSVSVKVLDFEK